MGVYSNILNQAQGVAGTPYQGYGGELVAGINPQQMMGIGNINAAQPWFGRATQMAYNAAQPIGSEQIQQYMSPYVQNVVDATQRQFGNMNAQQQQQVIGNAAAQNALGGNRTGIAQSQLANQQQLAQAPVISGLYNQGYSQALNTALAEQQAGLQGAYGVGNLAQAQLSGANAQIGAGTLQQQTQQQQDIANYQQFMNERAYPFQTLQWLAGLGTGVGSQMGGTTYGQATTTAPPPSWLGQLAGGLLGGAALLGGTGAFGQGGYMNFGGGGQRTAARGGRINAPVGVAGYQAGGGVADKPWSTSPQWADPNKWKPTGFVPGVDITRGQPLGYGGVHFVEPHKDTSQSGSPGMSGINQAVKAINQGKEGNQAAADARQDAAQDAEENAWPESADLQQVGPSDIGPAAQPIDVTTAAPTTTSSVVPSAAEVSSVVPEAATEAATSAGSLAEAGLGSSVGLADAGLGAGAGLTDAGLGAAGAGGDALAGLGAGIEGGGEALAGIGGEALAGLGAGASELFAGLGAESMAEVLPWLGMLLLNRGGRVNGVAGYQAGGGVADDDRLLFDPKSISGEDARDLQRFERIGDPNDDAPPRSAESLQAATGVAPGSEYSPLSASSIAGSAPEGFRKVIPASEVPMPQPSPIRPTPKFPAPAQSKSYMDAIPEGTVAEPAAAAVPAGVAPSAVSVPDTAAPAGVVPVSIGRPDPRPRYPVSESRDNRSLDEILLRAGAVTKRQESGGNYGNDTVTWSNRRKAYQHALGAYGIMDEDLPRWSKEALGREVTPQEFLRSKEIQDAIYNHRMGMYIQKYGVEGAGRAWLGGEGGVDKPWRRDPLGTSIGDYGRKFVSMVTGGQPLNMASRQSVDPDAPKDISAAGYAASKAPVGVAPAEGKKSGIDWSADNPMWLPAAAGFFQMASAASRPGATFAGSLGEGGLTGIQAYTSQEALRQKQKLSEREKDLRAQQLSQQAQHWQQSHDETVRFHNLTAYQKQQELSHKQQELDAKLAEPKQSIIGGRLVTTTRDKEGNLWDLETGQPLYGPKAYGLGAGQDPTTADQPAGKFQNVAFDPSKHGTFQFVSKANDSGRYDYADTSKLPVIEKGMLIPAPAATAGKSGDVIEAEAERYFQTGKAPADPKGNSPVALQQRQYQNAVQNYAMALAASRGMTKDEIIDAWRNAPLRGKFITGPQGNQTVALGTAMRHLGTLKEYAEAWNQAKMGGDTQPLNRIQALISRQWGSEAATNLNTVAHILGPEIVKAIGVANAGTFKDREDATAQFTTASSLEQINGAIKATEHLMLGQLVGKEGQAERAGVSPKDFQRLVGVEEYKKLRELDSHSPVAAPAAGAPAAGAPAAPPVRPPHVPEGARYHKETNTWYTRGPNGEAVPVPNP